MDISASKCSSGCESGWTTYLNQSSFGADQHYGRSFGSDYGGRRLQAEDEKEEEDLSMVSDASSGPPNYNEDDENGCLVKSSKKKNINIQHHGRKQHYSYLDDTASSPVLSFSKKKASMENHVLDTSQNFSATHVKGKSEFQKHFGFLKSSLAEKPNAK